MKRMLIATLACSTILAACTSKEPATKEPPEKESQPKETDPSFTEKDPSLSVLQSIWEFAQKGMISETPFNVKNDLFSQFRADWGEPDKIDQAGFGSYATYQSRNVAVGFHPTGEIFDLRSFDEKLHHITAQRMKETFGDPMEVRETGNEKIYVYQINETIELKAVVPNGQNTVDHISVFNPKRAESGNKADYTLDIKGRSNHLSEAAWQKMQEWRKQIVLFSKKYDHLYMNGPDEKRVALTFDDGPDNRVTPEIIDILKEYGVKGNFFFLGSAVEANPTVVQKAYNNGNLVLSHSYHHEDLTKFDENGRLREIQMAGSAIQAVIGKEPAMLRPPYGETDERVADSLQKEGYSIVLWSIDTLDWSQKEAGNIVKNVTDNARNGDIILMHSDTDKTETAKALPAIIEALQNKGFEIVDLETLLGVKAYR